MFPTVSVAIITYNHGPYIRQCLEGVLMQKTNFPIEVIIGEDCSTDDTRAIIKEFEAAYPTIIKPIYHLKNVGAARNAYEFCYPKLTGKYIAICEGDDYWTDPYKLQKQVDFLEQHPECVLCFHRINRVNEHDEIFQREPENDQVKLYTLDNILKTYIPTMSAVFRNLIGEIPKEMFKVRGADTFLFSMLTKDGFAADLGFIGAHYRKHPGGVHSSLNILKQFLHSLQTRKVMKHSSCFDKDQKKVIKKEILRRKTLYIKYFLKKLQIINCLKIACA
jgi:glycosyltransferase involved in cell wall biosynthesis